MHAVAVGSVFRAVCHFLSRRWRTVCVGCSDVIPLHCLSSSYIMSSSYICQPWPMHAAVKAHDHMLHGATGLRPVFTAEVETSMCGASCRFAPHLEKCLGKGRNASRLASRRASNV